MTGVEFCSLEPVRLLIVGRSEPELRALHSMTAQTCWQVSEARNSIAAVATVSSRQSGVVLVEHDVVTGNWARLISAFRHDPRAPRVIVYSSWADERLWAEVLSRGGFDVLNIPFDRNEVLRSIHVAWMSWKHGNASDFNTSHGDTVRDSTVLRTPRAAAAAAGWGG